MKPNWIMICIMFALSCLIGYGFYVGNVHDGNRWLLTIGSGLTVFVSLGGAFGLKHQSGGIAVNLTVVSVLFFILFLVSNVIFLFVPVVYAPYIIINGILLLIYVIIFYSVLKSIQ